MNPSLLLLQGVGCQGWLLNEERKQHHHYDARAEQKHLLQGVPRIVFLQEVRQHVHQGDVEKATRGEGQDPGYCLLSWGISCSRIAMVVRNPIFLLTRKLAATASP